MVGMAPDQGAAGLMARDDTLLVVENLVEREVEGIGVEGSQMVVLLKEKGTVYWEVVEDSLDLEEDVLLEVRAVQEYK
jgi:hypothetical protein